MSDDAADASTYCRDDYMSITYGGRVRVASREASFSGGLVVIGRQPEFITNLPPL